VAAPVFSFFCHNSLLAPIFSDVCEGEAVTVGKAAGGCGERGVGVGTKTPGRNVYGTWNMWNMAYMEYMDGVECVMYT
jgi:hypothetical protein